MWCVEGRGQALPALCWIGLALDLETRSSCRPIRTARRPTSCCTEVPSPSWWTCLARQTETDSTLRGTKWRPCSTTAPRWLCPLTSVDGRCSVANGQHGCRNGPATMGLRATILCKLHWEGHCYFQMQRIHWEAQQEASPLAPLPISASSPFMRSRTSQPLKGVLQPLRSRRLSTMQRYTERCGHIACMANPRMRRRNSTARAKAIGGMTSPILVSNAT